MGVIFRGPCFLALPLGFAGSGSVEFSGARIPKTLKP